MSGRRLRSRHSGPSSRITEDQIVDLVSKLRPLLPDQSQVQATDNKITAARVLQDTCSYIRSLHREVDDLSDDLSERISELLATADTAQAAVIRNLLMQ